MTKARNIRLYRACQRCRRRKLKCDPTTSPDGSYSPCFECMRAGESCVAAPASRRGGDFSSHRRQKQKQDNRTPTNTIQERVPAAQRDETEAKPDNPLYAELTNPGDALQILARLAASDSQPPVQAGQSSSATATSHELLTSDRGHVNDFSIGQGGLQSNSADTLLSDTEALVMSILGLDTTKNLLQHYSTNYHPFSPLTPKSLLRTSDIRQKAIDEPFILTVVLTIASKDDPGYQRVHQQCWLNLKKILLDILLAAPSTLNVGSVEGLLLLAEWVPYLQLETSSYAGMFPRNLSAVEDNMAWSLIGQAIRHSYLLRLDKVSFREKVHGEPEEIENRKRLAWIFVYICDRQISVRMGQSFWSRGPSLSTRFTATDFPSLRLSADAEHNYSLVLHATIELTQLLHNTHDIFYSSKDRRMQMMRWGDYSRYLDDFRRSMSSWEDHWDNLETSPKLLCTLRILKEYVRLYVMAFSFQSILSRAIHDSRKSESASTPSLFPEGIMTSADGTYVFEAVDSARKILEIANETDPVAHIRYMPFRFYVYTIYSAVFLYKAAAFGVFSTAEHSVVIGLVQRFIGTLEQAASSECHIGSRYSKLLNRIWFNVNGVTSQNNSGNIHDASFHRTRMSAMNQINDQTLRNTMELQSPEAIYSMSEFNLFSPNFSSLESQLFDFGGNGSIL